MSAKHSLMSCPPAPLDAFFLQNVSVGGLSFALSKHFSALWPGLPAPGVHCDHGPAEISAECFQSVCFAEGLSCLNKNKPTCFVEKLFRYFCKLC